MNEKLCDDLITIIWKIKQDVPYESNKPRQSTKESSPKTVATILTLDFSKFPHALKIVFD